MLRSLILLILVLPLAGCRTAPLAVSIPQELTTQGQRYEVKYTTPLKSGSPITFGPYSVTRLTVTRYKPTSETDGWSEQIHRGMIFSFVMASKSTSTQIPVDCKIMVDEKNLALNGKRADRNKVGQAEDSLRCRVDKGATMQAADYPENGIEMKLNNLAKVRSVNISPLPYIDELDNKLKAPSGFKITLGTGSTAAIDLSTDQHFYLIPRDPEHDLYLALGASIATIYTALKWQISDI